MFLRYAKYLRKNHTADLVPRWYSPSPFSSITTASLLGWSILAWLTFGTGTSTLSPTPTTLSFWHFSTTSPQPARVVSFEHCSFELGCVLCVCTKRTLLRPHLSGKPGRRRDQPSCGSQAHSQFQRSFCKESIG